MSIKLTIYYRQEVILVHRLKEFRTQKKISQQKLADYLNVSRSTVAMWETGGSEPDSDNLKKISDYFEVSIDALLGHDSNALTPPESTGGVWIPVVGKVAAGIPIFASEEILDYEEITKEMAANGEHFALQIKGDSMEPRIHAGDVVIVRRQSDCENGETAVVLVNGDEATVKRIKKSPEGIMLISNNPAYEPMFYSNKEIEELPVCIIGRVVELRGKF